MKEYSYLDSLLSEIITELEVNRAIESHFMGIDRERWYRQSYPNFLRYFKENKNTADEYVWSMKVACVGSWVQRIFTANIEPELLKKLQYIEERFSIKRLWDSGIELHQDGDILIGGTAPHRISDFLIVVNDVLNDSERGEENVSSGSKLLHFMAPDLFPILDRNIAEKLFGTKNNLNELKYYFYILGIQKLFPAKSFLFDLSMQYKLPVLRLIDITVSKTSKKNEEK